MVAGPKVSHLVAAYEAMSGAKDGTINTKHHEQTLIAQRSFFENVEALFTVLKEMGNPFQEESADLMVLDTKDPALAEVVSTYHDRGKEKFKSFMEALQNEQDCTFYQPIRKNKVFL